MHNVQVSKTIDGRADLVWTVLDNFANTSVYHPIVADSGATNGQQRGLGAERFCELYSGGRVEERITAHDEAARRYEVTVIDHGPFPMKDMKVTISVAAAGSGRSKVTYAADFVPKFGPVGWLMAKAMMKGQFAKMFDSLIDGVETHVRTGQVVGKGGTLELKRAA